MGVAALVCVVVLELVARVLCVEPQVRERVRALEHEPEDEGDAASCEAGDTPSVAVDTARS